MKASIIEELPRDLALEPLAGVEVTLFHDPEDVHRGPEEARRWSTEATSSEDGTFVAGGATAPGWFEVAVRARRPGCLDVIQNFPHDKAEHTIYVVLICESG